MVRYIRGLLQPHVQWVSEVLWSESVSCYSQGSIFKVMAPECWDFLPLDLDLHFSSVLFVSLIVFSFIFNCESVCGVRSRKVLNTVNKVTDLPSFWVFSSSLPLSPGSFSHLPLRPTLHRQTVSLMLATVQLSTVWVMSKAYQFLSSWSLSKFLLITQGDLKVGS